MNILIINSGSSSLKFSLINPESQEELLKGLIEIHNRLSMISYTCAGKSNSESFDCADHKEAIAKLMELLKEFQLMDQVHALAHRVVHGGSQFTQATIITPTVLNQIEACIPLAPLHNPANLLGIQTAIEAFPGLPQVAMFDTAFASSMPEKAKTYPLPLELKEKHAVQRYGFHGISHEYLTKTAHAMLAWERSEKKKIITLHLGNGCSLAASEGGTCLDTTMGLTPNEGLAMGTRSGSIDPGIFLYLKNQLGWSIEEIDNTLNKKSGLLGLSQQSSDMRTVSEQAAAGDAKCQLALDVFLHRLMKEIGASIASISGVDAIVFSGGIGENAKAIRQAVCQRLSYLGFQIDNDLNDANIKNSNIAGTGSLPILLVATQEELNIALHASACLKGAKVYA